MLVVKSEIKDFKPSWDASEMSIKWLWSAGVMNWN